MSVHVMYASCHSYLVGVVREVVGVILVGLVLEGRVDRVRQFLGPATLDTVLGWE